jgi:hypothetical protein
MTRGTVETSGLMDIDMLVGRQFGKEKCCRDVGRTLDTLDAKLKEISKNPKLILNERFMMNIFEEFRDELPPFVEYWNDQFTQRKISPVSKKSGAKVVALNVARKYLFKPVRQTDKDTTDRVIELAKVAVDAIITELHDDSKATHKYVSASGSRYSWKHSSVEDRGKMLGRKATNDEAESALGGTTYQIQKAWSH